MNRKDIKWAPVNESRLMCRVHILHATLLLAGFCLFFFFLNQCAFLFCVVTWSKAVLGLLAS